MRSWGPVGWEWASKLNCLAAEVGLIPPEAVADMAVVLAGQRFRFTAGGFLTVDGGLAGGFPRVGRRKR